jgi:alkyl sulfatase BDS1-like metallo-beta-lactamase superfamily hydrolase
VGAVTPLPGPSNVTATIEQLVDHGPFRRALMAVENAVTCDAENEERRAAVRALRNLAYEAERLADEIGRVL